MPDTAEFQIPTDPRTRRRGAREAVICVLVATLVLLVIEGPSIRHSAQKMDAGVLRTLTLAVGRPAGWVGDRLPLHRWVRSATAWLSPDSDLGTAGGASFAGAAVQNSSNAVVPVTASSFDPRALGLKAPALRGLRKLLVTGDSMSQPLDSILARRLATAGRATQTLRDPHLGTGISKSELVDWSRLSVRQAVRDRPDAVVVFIGANEGFPMPDGRGRSVACCGPDWAAVYATRVRTMMNTYRREGLGRVYWLTLPMPRDPARQAIARVVNAAVAVAAEPYRSQVRVLDMSAIFTPDLRYREAMPVGGQQRLVRRSDGIHLNDAGSELAADAVMAALRGDFTL